LELARNALALLEPMLENSPDEPRYLRREMAQQRLQALALQKLGDYRNAAGLMRDVLARARALTSRLPANQAVKADLFTSLMTCSALLLESGDREEGLKQARETLALAEQMAALRPQDLHWQWRLADSHSLLGSYYMAIANNRRLPSSERTAARQEARVSLQKALRVWDE
jgi:hypothetical protein